MFQSIRVRLALSFAAIAVFAVFTLGVVLLAALPVLWRGIPHERMHGEEAA